MIDIPAMQRRLGVTDDGIAGPITYGTLMARVARRPFDEHFRALGKGCAAYFPGLIDTGLRLAHFIGQTAHESGGFRWLREIWGPTPTQLRYDGRRDLGNVHPGDGRRYLGRGLIQLTGRSNYRAAGERLDLDLEANPALAELPDIAVAVSCDYWRANALNRWADRDDTVALSRAINCGNPLTTRTPNGMSDRRAMTNIARLLVLG